MKDLLAKLFILKAIVCVSSQNEIPIILSLIQDLEIRSCFLVYENGNHFNVLTLEKILFKNIFTAFISYEKLIEYVDLREHVNDGIGMISMANDLARIEKISEELDLVNNSFSNIHKV